MKYYIYSWAQWEPVTGWRFYNSHGDSTSLIDDITAEKKFHNQKAVVLLSRIEISSAEYNRYTEEMV